MIEIKDSKVSGWAVGGGVSTQIVHVRRCSMDAVCRTDVKCECIYMN